MQSSEEARSGCRFPCVAKQSFCDFAVVVDLLIVVARC